MLDPTNIYPNSFHPVAMGRSKDFHYKVKGYSRTRRPTGYLLIDFSLSCQYDLANGPPLDEPLHGSDRSAPEHQDGETPCNPFPTDVYYLGNLVRVQYIQVRVPSSLLKGCTPDAVTRNAKGSNSWSLLSPTWSKKILESALAWMKLFPVFLRSRESSVRGSCAPGSPVGMRSGQLQHGDLLAIGSEPCVMSS